VRMIELWNLWVYVWDGGGGGGVRMRWWWVGDYYLLDQIVGSLFLCPGFVDGSFQVPSVCPGLEY